MIGVTHLLGLIEFQTTKTDTWIVLELGGYTLPKTCYEMKGEFYKGERVYNVEEKINIYIF